MSVKRIGEAPLSPAGLACVLALAGCSSKEPDPPATPPRTPTPVDAAPVDASPPLIDVASAARCRVSYTCTMSHPGLGTSSNSTVIDLPTCQRTTSATYSPDEKTPAPPPAHPVLVKLDKAACDRVASAAAAVTKAEAAHHESAPIDSSACFAALVCGEKTIYSVQRQTPDISDHVSLLLTAMAGG